MLHDEEVRTMYMRACRKYSIGVFKHYPNPMEFRPERFLDSDDNLRRGINVTPTTTFGFGRRICPGRWLALDTIWIVAASVLDVYRIMNPVNAAGQEVEPSVEYTSGLFRSVFVGDLDRAIC